MSKDLRYSFVCLYSFNGIWTPGEVQSSLPASSVSVRMRMNIREHSFSEGESNERWNVIFFHLLSAWLTTPAFPSHCFLLTLQSLFSAHVHLLCIIARKRLNLELFQSSFSGCHYLLSPVELMLIHKISSAHLLLSLNVPNSMTSREKVNETILIFNPEAPKVELFAFSCFLYCCRYTDSKTQASARSKCSVYLSGVLFFLLLCPYDVRACLHVCLWHTAPFSSVQGSITIRLSGNIVADRGTH